MAAPIPLPSRPGTYVLVFHLTRRGAAAVGRLGEVSFPPGYLLYAGSALGPGGLAGRVRRHLRSPETRRPHWHVDALAAIASPEEVWWQEGVQRSECRWADTLATLAERRPPGFGASDCRCPGHLIHIKDRQGLESAWRVLCRIAPGGLMRWRPAREDGPAQAESP